MSIPRMRTVAQALDMIKEQDKDSAVTMNCIRSLCKRGIVKNITVGNKLLVDFDNLVKQLSNSCDNGTEIA